MTDRYAYFRAKSSGYQIGLVVLLVVALAGYLAAHYMDSNGHHVSGMNNQVVWGLPHVFAILLIVAASGALNVASLSSVLGQSEYSPWARLSAMLSACLLVGGLLVLVLDLGRPERLIVAMTHFNFRSVFTWNILLYTGLLLVIAIYLWTLFEPGAKRYGGKAGLLAFSWRFVLTGGTGSIFGFLVARQFYDAAILIPQFIVLSLMVGTAAFLIVSRVLVDHSNIPRAPEIEAGLLRLLGLFVAAELFLVAAFHLTNLYSAEHRGIERFILFEGGGYTALFWLGQIVIGSLLPLWQVFVRGGAAMLVSGLVVFGALCQLYVLIIGGQAYPLLLFPGKSVSSSFYDGVVASYSPSLPELLLGMGGVSVALLALLLAARVLPLLPDPQRVQESGL